ncbi:MAG TPA: SDR family NAD(P)-dependent oxidoreductase [Tepidisphaeraceae bacterium]
MHSNSMLITGGGSGIGRRLAATFHNLGNQVLIAGRRAESMRRVCDANPGMRYFILDVTDPASIGRAASQVVTELPALSYVFNNAGVQGSHEFSADERIDKQASLHRRPHGPERC